MKKAILMLRRPCGYSWDIVRTTSQPPRRNDDYMAWLRLTGGRIYR